MKERFEGANGKRLLIEALKTQKTIGNVELAEKFANVVEVLDIAKGTELITQEAYTNDVYFILTGTFKIIINGKHVADRSTDDLIGEMTAVEPTQKRSATAIAIEDSVVAKTSEENFSEIGSVYPILYKSIAKVLAKRLLQRNNFISVTNKIPRVFIISSAEGKHVAELIQACLEHEQILIKLWTQDVFRVTHYALQALENEVDQADFAIAIATGDDIVESREVVWPAVRDNVIFELGLFMGRLGRERSILMEPRGEKVKLPSDMMGVTTIGYRYTPGLDEQSIIGPAIHKIKTHIKNLGVR